MYFFVFFFQAEDGIRDRLVTGVQTCALPILQSTPWDPDFAQQLPSSRSVLSNEDAPKWELIRQVVPNDRLLTLKPAEATLYGLVRGIVTDDAALALWFGAQEVRRYDINWSEKLVRILVSWPIRIILIAIFLVCVFVEFVTGASGA